MAALALLAVSRALVHAPPFAAYLWDETLVEADLTPKRLNACAVLRNVRTLAQRPTEALDFLDVLAKYHKSCARATVDVHTLAVRVLQACHEALKGRPPILDPSEPLKNDHWSSQEWSFVLEVFGLQLDGETHAMSLCVPVTGTSLAKCFRDTGVTVTRYPPMLVVYLKNKKGFVDYTMDWDVAPGQAYRLCAVVCHDPDNEYWTMAESGNGWIEYRQDASSPLKEMNALITKDAVMLLYKNRR